MSPKPLQQKSSGVAPIIDGIVAKRVQTIGSNVDITREQANELANSGVVEYISDSPTVSIQIDTNDVGSTDTLALLTDKMIPYTATSKSDTRQGFGNMKFFIRSTASNASYRTLTEQDMLNGYCSILATLNQQGTSAARTMWMNRAALTGVALSYDVNGNATENYTLSADNKTWFFNAYANVRCYKPQFYQLNKSTGVANVRGVTFVNLGSAIPNNSSPVAVGINNTILRKRGNGVTGNASFFTNNLTAGGVQVGSFVCTTYALSTPFVSTSASSTDRVWVIFRPPNRTLWEASALSTDPGWELESTGGAIGAIRRGKIKAYLYNTNLPVRATSTLAGKALRLQTVSIDVALGEEQLFELGTEGFYAISKNSPVPVTVTLTANDSDLEYFANLVGTTTGTNVRQLTISDFQGTNAVKVEIYRDNAQTTLLKTITCSNLFVQNENFNVTVGDDAVNEITLTCDNITVAGSGANILGGFYGAK